jgi:hypothetical protein
MTMLKTLLTAFASLALAAAVGCSDNGTTPNGGMDGSVNNNPDMAQMQGSPDMAFVCVMNPVTNDDFLNSCAPASVDQIDIMPFYPSQAPNGVLPALP